MKKWWSAAAVLVSLLLMSLGMTVCAAESTILKGITIEGVDVSGMTKDEAMNALRLEIRRWMHRYHHSE